ncbi:hypothetical protein PS1_030131 [Malus domestica]
MEGFIRDGHKEEMKKKTPFWKLFKAYRDGHVTNEFCKKVDTNVKIVKQYNKDMKFFVFGDIYARFTPSDIAIILGLPNTGFALKHTATFDCLLSSLQKLVNPNSVNSCVVALLCLIINMVLKHFWACGKTRLCNKIAGRKNISLSFLTWSMIYFHEKLIQIDLSTMKPHVNHAMVFDTHADHENILIEKYTYADDENVLIEKDDTHEINVNRDDTNPQSAVTNLVKFDTPNWQLIAPQDFCSTPSKFSPIVRPLVIATNGMNDSAIEKSTPHLRMSEIDVRCETAEIIVDLLTELLMIADNDLEAAMVQIKSLIKENKKLKK